MLNKLHNFYLLLEINYLIKVFDNFSRFKNDVHHHFYYTMKILFFNKNHISNFDKKLKFTYFIYYLYIILEVLFMYKLAIVGATGLVGRTILKILEEKNLPIYEYVLFSSKKSAGKVINFKNKDYIVKELTENSFIEEHFDYAIFSAGRKYLFKIFSNCC